MKLIIAGGGTGGHLFPGIAVAEEFLARDRSNEVLFVGTSNGIEARAVPAAGYKLELISAAGIRGKGLVSQIRGGLMMLNGFRQSRKIIKTFRPDMVLGVGGYASLPMLLAARQLNRSTYIHEQNAVPGKTNRLLGRLVDQVFITVEESAGFFDKTKTMLTGNPLRRQILERTGIRNPESGTRNLETGIRDQGPVKDFSSPGSRVPSPGLNLLVFGGSQGARAINKAMVGALDFLKDFDGKLSIVHQTGANELEEVCQAYRNKGVAADVSAFIDDMASAYQQADLIVCRAGATTIAELTACGKAAIFIPFPYAVDDHQLRNAEALIKKGAGFMLLEKDLSGSKLAEIIIQLAKDRRLLENTGKSAFSMARLDAAKIIVDEMTEKAEKTG